jgi:peptide/nickel transport system substrate-binding protein
MLGRRLLGSVPLVVLVACNGGETGGPAVPPPGGDANAPRDTLVVALGSDIDSLNVVTSSSASDGAIIDNLFVPLVDSDFDCSLKKVPGWATSWDWSEDGKTIKMTLRDDLTWYDGVKVTPKDLQFTYELLGDQRVTTPRANMAERLTADGRPMIIDDTHIEWHFTEAYDRDTQMSHVDLGYLPEHVLRDADRETLKGNAFSKNPLVNGPFKLAKYEPAQRVVLEPNEKFTGPEEMRPKLARVVFKIIPEYSTRLLELQNGEIDMMEAIRIPDTDMLKKEHPNINLVRRGYRSMDYVAWNLKDPLFTDKRVRQALAKAADIDDMIGKLLTNEAGEAFARPAIGTITPELCGVFADDVLPYKHNADESKALLADAGWKDSNGDGVLDKGGKKFEFTVMTNQENPRRNDAAIRLQSQFKDIGVVMNIERLEFNNMTDRLKRRDFQAALAGWSAALYIDPSDMWHTDSPDRPSEFNYPSYSNPEVDAMIEQGMRTPQPEQAAPIWKEMQRRIYDDQPYLFLWWMDEVDAIDGRFSTYHINLLSTLFHLYDWEVPADKVKYPR